MSSFSRLKVYVQERIFMYSKYPSFQPAVLKTIRSPWKKIMLYAITTV